MGKPWQFTQLGGAKRTITLAGASAPHGRRRRDPVVSDGVKLRRARVYYPDSKGSPPTTIVAGTAWDDVELRGRFDDRDLGLGGTSDMIRQWQTFVVDAQLVQIIWGDIWAATGIVDAFIPGRESQYECTYTIKLLIDERDIGTGQSVFVLPKSPTQLCSELTEVLTTVTPVPSLPHAEALKPDLLESIDDAVSSVNSFSASLIRIAGEIDAFEEGTLDQLERLRAGVAQMKTAANRLRETMDSANNDAALLYSAADADVQWIATKTSTDVSTTRMLSILDEMDREADLARRGRVLSVYVARAADSFESISTRFYGGPDGAGDIRDANGVRYGELPFPGRSYQIPTRA